MDIKQAIAKVVERVSLSEEESFAVMSFILRGEATGAQIASLITAMRMKGEEIDEITGFARAMRSESVNVSIPGVEIVDTCGTGGDKKHTFNISTVSAFVAAGAGVTVAKHGNRSVSSKCGSADVLQELGINIMLGAAGAEQCMRRAGIAFFFAPVFHSAMKHAAAPRKETGLRTIFNILGPLTNPAGARFQLLGVYEQKLVEKMAHVLGRLGSKRAMVVYGMDGLDEISICGKTFVGELENDKVKTYFLDPDDYGIKKCRSIEKLSGGGPSENAEIFKNILSGEKSPRRDVVVLNAAAAVMAAGGCVDFFGAVSSARESIDSGRALSKFNLLREVSNEL